jgi:hypothetical protein
MRCLALLTRRKLVAPSAVSSPLNRASPAAAGFPAYRGEDGLRSASADVRKRIDAFIAWATGLARSQRSLIIAERP